MIDPWLLPLIIGVLGAIPQAVGFVRANIRSHDPEWRDERIMSWWFDADFDKLGAKYSSAKIDWYDFEATVEELMLKGDDDPEYGVVLARMREKESLERQREQIKAYEEQEVQRRAEAEEIQRRRIERAKNQHRCENYYFDEAIDKFVCMECGEEIDGISDWKPPQGVKPDLACPNGTTGRYEVGGGRWSCCCGSAACMRWGWVPGTVNNPTIVEDLPYPPETQIYKGDNVIFRVGSEWFLVKPNPFKKKRKASNAFETHTPRRITNARP